MYEDVSVTPVRQLMNTPHQKNLVQAEQEMAVEPLQEKDAEIYPKNQLKSLKNGFLITAITLIHQMARK
jgi:hypothetical protein